MKYKKNKFINLHFMVLICFLISCESYKKFKFDTNKWNQQTDPLFPSSYRSMMLRDLTSNYKLVGFKYSEIIKLLGIPDYKDSNSLSYKIAVEYGHDIDPVYTKNLNFMFSGDSVITSFKVEEWKK